ncbi:38019_t:CDS:2, partial [Gigaspora margarita]
SDLYIFVMLQPPLLIEGPKFSFNFEFSSNSFHLSQRFVINNQPIYLYNPSEECSLDKSLNNDEPLEHTILTSTSVWDAGSGTSIPSITTSILGAKQVTITDAPSVIPQIKNIIKLNSLLKKPVNVESLDWVNGKENLETLKNGRWDYILGSDIVWVDHLIKPLIETIDVLSTPSYTKLLISHQSRTVRCDNLFFNGLKDLGWKLDKISHDELNWEEGFLKDGVEIYYGYKE